MATASCLAPEGVVLRLEETVGLTLHVPHASLCMQASVQRQRWQSKIHAYGPPMRIKAAAAAASLSLCDFKQCRQQQIIDLFYPLSMQGRTHGET